jgi:hypothetical protein
MRVPVSSALVADDEGELEKLLLQSSGDGNHGRMKLGCHGDPLQVSRHCMRIMAATEAWSAR